MRRVATGCARVVSRRAKLAAVSSQFWKTVRVAQHLAATPPCLSRGIRSTAVKMDEKLYMYMGPAHGNLIVRSCNLLLSPSIIV